MKKGSKGQGAKGRSTLPEALRGELGKGLAADFLYRLHSCNADEAWVKTLEGLQNRTAVQDWCLGEARKARAERHAEIISILQEAVREGSRHPSFFQDVGHALTIKAPVYPVEVRVLNKYCSLKSEPTFKTEPEQRQHVPRPFETPVSYQRLFEASQDENGIPDAAQFSKIVKRYGLILVKGKPGRESQVRRHPRAKRSR